MARYIDADKLVLWCNETYQVQSTVTGKAYVNDFLTKVLSCPTANVAPIADTVKKMRHELITRVGSYKDKGDTACFGLFYRIITETTEELLSKDEREGEG